MFSRYATVEGTMILVTGAAMILLLPFLGLWWVGVFVIAGMMGLLELLRDPERKIPLDKGLVVSPADGVVDSVVELDGWAPFEGPALRVRITTGLLDVHVMRAPCHGRVATFETYAPSIVTNEHAAEDHGAVATGDSDDAHGLLILWRHAIMGGPLAAIVQRAGQAPLGATYSVNQDAILERGERLGMVKFGAITDLYIPVLPGRMPELQINTGERVTAGETVLAQLITRQSTVEHAGMPPQSSAQPNHDHVSYLPDQPSMPAATW